MPASARQLVLAACMTTLLAVATPIATADEGTDRWTHFRGNDGAGVSDAQTIPTTFTAKDYNWRVELAGKGHSSPVVFGDRVFLTCVDAEAQKRYVVCHRTSDGKELWRAADPFEPHSQHRLNSFASATPAVDDAQVYVAWTNGADLVALALDHDGGEVWKKKIGRHQARHGSGASPVVVGDTLIVANDNEGEESSILGLDRKTGATRWKVPRTTTRAAFSTPTVHRRGDGTAEVLLASTSHGLTSVDAATGKVLWEVGGLFTKRCVASPVVAGDIVFVTAGTGGGGKESAAVAFPSGDAPAAVRYKIDRGLPYVPTGVVRDDLLFLWADGGIVSCFDAATGATIWQERIAGQYFASPIRVGDSILCVSTEGKLETVAAGREFAHLGTVDLGEPSNATPAVAGGTLYVRTLTHMISVGGGSPAAAPKEKKAL